MTEKGIYTDNGVKVWFEDSEQAPARAVVPLVEYSNSEILRAMRTVIVYTITDVFNLSEEEIMFVVYKVDRALTQVAGLRSHVLPAAVKLELLTQEYSGRLNKQPRPGFTAPVRDNGRTTQADITTWATVISDVITECYDIRPMVVTALIGQISAALIELGVGNEDDPRASLYLPSNVRWLLNAS